MPRKLLLALFLSLLPLALFFSATPTHAGAIIIVNSNLDVLNPNDSNCTLREAIIAANTDTASGGAYAECPAGSGADTILLPPGTYTLTLAGTGEDNSLTGDLDLKSDLTIQGNGFGCLLNPTCTSINGNGIDRVFDITTTAHITITELDIVLGQVNFGGGGVRNRGALRLKDVYFSNNSTTSGGGGLLNENGFATLDTVGFVLNRADTDGGAIFNSGSAAITVTNSLFTFDSAGSYGGGLSNYGNAMLSDTTLAYETVDGLAGGAIATRNSLILDRVTLDHNQATDGYGAGIYAEFAMTLTNVTLSHNDAISTTSKGGGIYVVDVIGTTSANLTNVTIIRNAANVGGGIYNNGAAVSLRNTILDINTGGGNCAGSAITSLGYNLDNANTCALSATGDITNTDPLLGPLASNGGTTFTHALLPGSPAINKIPFGTNGCGTTITTDQRGYARLSPCDIGAFEYVLRAFLPLILK